MFSGIKNKRAITYWLAVISVIIFGVVLTLSISTRVFAVPATFTVTNTDDSGPGSLRQAITDANSNGNPADMDIVEFNIPGSEVHTINILSDLPAVTEKLTIDGYTQPGAQANTSPSPEPFNNVIKIEVAGTNGTFAQGAIGLLADDSVIKGLSVFDAAVPDSNFERINIALIGSNTKIQGSYVGVRADGTTIGTSDRNCVGVVSNGANVEVGGSNPEDRNILFSKCSISQSAAYGPGGGSVSVYGNYFGMAKDGITDLTPELTDANGLSSGPFTIGMNLLNTSGSVSQIGGSGSGQRNLISGNSIAIAISGSNNAIQGNYIGTDYTGSVRDSITNGLGIGSSAGFDSLIGGTGTGEGNLIAGVSGSGIEIANFKVVPLNFELSPNRIAILGNSIHDITPFTLAGIGDSNLGIDLSLWTDTVGDFTPDQFTNRGPTANDLGDADL